MNAVAPSSNTAHLCVLQPAGCTQALEGLQAALRLRSQLQDLGVRVTLSKQRLRHEAINVVFGVDWGFDAEAAIAAGHRLLLVDQRGDMCGRPPQDEVSAAIVAALQPGAADHSADPRSAQARRLFGRLPSLSLGTAAETEWSFPWWPALVAAEQTMNPAQRPIAVLFTAAPPSPRQAAVLTHLQQHCGLSGLARLESPLFADERAALVSQAQWALCLLGDDGAAPDAAQIRLCVASGTPVLAEKPMGQPAPEWEGAEAVHWFELDQAATHLQQLGLTAEATLAHRTDAAQQAWQGLSQSALHIRARDRMRQCWTWMQARATAGRSDSAMRPLRLNAAMARHGYLSGDWLNASADPADQPDLRLGAEGVLTPDSIAELSGRCELIWLNDDAPIHTPVALDQALDLLAEGGRVVMHLAVPGAVSTTVHGADADAEWRQALAAELAPWTDTFWQRPSASLLHRLDWVHLGRTVSDSARPARVRVCLRKRATSYQERTRARVAREDFGGLASG